MKTASFLSAVLVIVMVAASLGNVFISNAAYAPTVKPGCISFSFNQVNGGTVNNLKTASITTNVLLDGINTVRFTPAPTTDDSLNNTDWFTVDCYALANYTAKVNVPQYKYLGITYYYESSSPMKNIRPVIFIPFGTGAITAHNLPSTEDLVANEWREAVFDFSDVPVNSGVESPWIKQIQFCPFNNTNPSKLSANDNLYIAKYTFYETPPTEEYVPEKNPASIASGTPGIGDGYISFEYNKVGAGMVGGLGTAAFTKTSSMDGVTASKFTPTPNTSDSKNNDYFYIDCYGLDGFPQKVNVPKYKYLGITYYYETSSPVYTGKLKADILPGNAGALYAPNLESSQNIVQNQWAEAVFDFSHHDVNKSNEKLWIPQVHFYPFANTKPSALSASENFYIAKYTFYEEYPDETKRYKASFLSGYENAAGTMASMAVKPDSPYILPECGFTLENASFFGWSSSYDGMVYKPGTAVTTGTENVSYSAEWVIKEAEGPDYISLGLVDYVNGVVNGDDTGTITDVIYDGRSAVKCVPNPSATKDEYFSVDGWGYKSAGVNLEEYKWMTVEYLYLSPDPKDFRLRIDVTSSGGALIGNALQFSKEKARAGIRATAVFDFRELESILNPNTTDHDLRQVQITPFGALTVDSLTKDDVIYLNRISFFKEEPIVHGAYIEGYGDGSFRAYKNLTRAEACAIVSRALENGREEGIAGTPSFADAKNHWASKYIGYCDNKGLLDFVSGSFLPDEAMTQSDFARLAMNMSLYLGGSFSKSTPVPSAVGEGDEPVTRLQAVTLINKLRKQCLLGSDAFDEIAFSFSDVENEHWSYSEIAEATVPHTVSDGVRIYSNEELADIGAEMTAVVDELSESKKSAVKGSSSDYTTVTGKYIYVSPSGSDSNNGSRDKPVLTVSKANSLASSGDGILLERGGLWRETFTAKSGVTYSAYGAGAKPMIYGSPENGADSSKWTLHYENSSTGAKIWKYSNTGLGDIGTMVLNNGENFAPKEIPSFESGRYFVRGTQNPFVLEEQLDRNFEFFQDISAAAGSDGYISMGSAAKGPIYFRCDEGNPGSIYESIEFNVYGNVISVGGNGVTIDNLCIKYGGSHGIGAGTVSGLSVKNCEIGWIGGSIQTYGIYGGNRALATRYGNGVEVYGACDGFKVEDCYIYECYDAGVTHQHSGVTNNAIDMSNVLYKNNLIERCVYGIEYFLYRSETDSSAPRSGKNIMIDGNILRFAGYGFGSVRPDTRVQRHIRSGAAANPFENFVVKNNIFDRSVHELFQMYTDVEAGVPLLVGNTYIQGIDNGFFTFGVGGKYSTRFSSNASSYIKSMLGDAEGKVYYTESIPYYSYPYFG